jgi:hypothetical protein
MPRARHPTPFQLRTLTFDPSKGKYFIQENGITYFMNLEETRLLKEYFRGTSSGSVFEWYTSLPEEIRLLVNIKYKK